MEKKQQLPPDEQRCTQTGGTGIKRYRCKNFRMGYGAAAADDTKSKRCEKHYIYFRKKKRSGDHGKETNKVTEEEDDDTSDIEGGFSNVGTKKKLPPDEQRCSQTGGGGWRCKNFRMGHGAAADRDTVPKTKFCENHYNYYAKYYQKKKQTGNGETKASKWGKKVLEEDEIHKLGATRDHTSDTIVEGSSAKTRSKRKNVERSERSGELKALTKTVVKTRASKRRKKVMEGHRFVDETNNQPAADDNCDSDAIIEGGSANNGRKRKYAERMSGEPESLTGSREPSVELESLEHYKIKCFELSVELEKKELELVKKKEDLEKMKVECTKLHGKLVEVETRKTTTTDETEQTPATDETEQAPADATECWKKLLSDLESLLQSKENENSTMGCVESRISSLEILVLKMKSKNSTTGRCVDSHISNCESLVFRSEKESSILKCVELRNSERVESEVPGLQNDITQNCGNTGKLTDEISRSKLNADEISTGGRKDSHVYECKAKEKVLNVCDVGANKHHDTESEFPKYSAMNISSSTLHLSSEGQNVEEGKDWGSSSKRPSQHGTSSQDHLDISKEPFANSVSDDGGESLGKSEDFESSVNSENSLGDPMDMLGMKNWNRNKDEMKWKSEADMLSSFEEDVELCLKAICALYRQEISEDEISPKGLLFHNDTLRCTTLAKFLMDKDCKGDVNKSVKELEMFDSKAVEDCKRLVRRYSIYLFDIYEKGKDPFFLPAITASHGDQTSK